VLALFFGCLTTYTMSSQILDWLRMKFETGNRRRGHVVWYKNIILRPKPKAQQPQRPPKYTVAVKRWHFRPCYTPKKLCNQTHPIQRPEKTAENNWSNTKYYGISHRHIRRSSVKRCPWSIRGHGPLKHVGADNPRSPSLHGA
jgi:hypothetical protein